MPESVGKHPLDGAYARLERAREHLANLEGQIASFRDDQSARFEIDLVPGTQKLRIGANRRAAAPPPIFRILIGEIVYNLRAALDYLVYELAILDSGSSKSGTQFPIEQTAKGFADRRRRFLNGLTDDHVAAIERLQPYAGSEWAGRLASLSNPDKHRHLTATASLNDARFRVHAVKPGTSPPHPTTRVFAGVQGRDELLDVHVDPDVSVEIAFDDEAETNVLETLGLLARGVGGVLDSFAQEFD